MLSREFQAALPDNMYVYPIDKRVPLPKLWAKWATVSPHPWRVSPTEIADKRADWLRDWRDLTTQ
jgi:thiamine transport system substrate-binding protein